MNDTRVLLLRKGIHGGLTKRHALPFPYHSFVFVFFVISPIISIPSLFLSNNFIQILFTMLSLPLIIKIFIVLLSGFLFYRKFLFRYADLI